MKILVIGATGRIGEKLVPTLRQRGLNVTEASPTRGVNTVTGEGLEAALRGAAVVIDVSDSPSSEGLDALRFFETSTQQLLAAGQAAGVQRHIALSIVGTDRLQAGGYFQAKQRQEELIKASGMPYSLLRSTQFFEFIAGVVQSGPPDGVIIAPVLAQPVSGLDVAAALADLALGEPLNRTVELAGPQQWRLSDVATEVLTAYEDPRCVIADPDAPYFGARLTDDSLLPGPEARIGTLLFEDWLRQSLQPNSRPPASPQPAVG